MNPKSNSRIDSANGRSSEMSDEDSYKLKDGIKSPFAAKGNMKAEDQLTSNETDGEISSEEDTEGAEETKDNGKILAPPEAGVASTVKKGKCSKASQKKAPRKAPPSVIQRPKAQTKISSPKSLDTDIDGNVPDDEHPIPSPQPTSIAEARGKGPTILKMTTKISNLARDSFEVAELWEGFLKRHTSGQENSIRKVGEAMDKITGKRKVTNEGESERKGDKDGDEKAGSKNKKTKAARKNN